MDRPNIHPAAWVAPGAFVRGDVTIGEQSNIWYNAVLRGDQEKITVGKATTIQDCCVLHGDAGCDVVVGDYVTVGHGAVLHGYTVEDNCLIGTPWCWTTPSSGPAPSWGPGPWWPRAPSSPPEAWWWACPAR